MTSHSWILTCISKETPFHEIKRAIWNCFDVSERQWKLPYEIIAIRYPRDNPLATNRCLNKWWAEGSLPPFWVVGWRAGSDFSIMTDISVLKLFLVLIFGIHKHMIMLYTHTKFHGSRASTFEAIQDQKNDDPFNYGGRIGQVYLNSP